MYAYVYLCVLIVMYVYIQDPGVTFFLGGVGLPIGSKIWFPRFLCMHETELMLIGFRIVLKVGAHPKSSILRLKILELERLGA